MNTPPICHHCDLPMTYIQNKAPFGSGPALMGATPLGTGWYCTTATCTYRLAMEAKIR